MKKKNTLTILITIFLLALAINGLWEHAHSVLYTHYEGGTITEGVLFTSTLSDALFITALGWLFMSYRYLRNHIWLSLWVGIVVAIIVELVALHVGLWEYSAYMPRIPVLGTGLTPTIQLGLISYIIFKIVNLEHHA